MDQLGRPGVKWTLGLGVPEEAYEVDVTSDLGDSVGWLNLEDRDDPRLTRLLLWVYQSHVHKVTGNDVLWNEELVFLVKDSRLQRAPHWEVDLKVFFHLGPVRLSGQIQTGSQRLLMSSIQCVCQRFLFIAMLLRFSLG